MVVLNILLAWHGGHFYNYQARWFEEARAVPWDTRPSLSSSRGQTSEKVHNDVSPHHERHDGKLQAHFRGALRKHNLTHI